MSRHGTRNHGRDCPLPLTILYAHIGLFIFYKKNNPYSRVIFGTARFPSSTAGTLSALHDLADVLPEDQHAAHGLCRGRHILRPPLVGVGIVLPELVDGVERANLVAPGVLVAVAMRSKLVGVMRVVERLYLSLLADAVEGHTDPRFPNPLGSLSRRRPDYLYLHSLVLVTPSCCVGAVETSAF